MKQNTRSLSMAAGIAVFFAGTAVYGQPAGGPPPLPIPVIADAPPPGLVPPPPPRIGGPSSYVAPTEPLFPTADPLLERPGTPPPGPFANLETDFVGVHVKNRLTNTVTIDGTDDTVHVPGEELGWTVAPRFELGYRLPEGLGEFLIGYRFFFAEGTADAIGDDLTGRIKSRVNLNEFDFDYATREYSLAPNWDMKWKLGARLAGFFYDSRADLLILRNEFAGTHFDQSVSNNFWGAGPHAGLLLERQLDIPGLALYGQVEGATLLGQIHQRFSEDFTAGRFSQETVGGETCVRHSQAVPMLNVQLGLRWMPPAYHHGQFFFGYVYEHWWSLGKANDSALELSDQGIAFRGEFNF